MCVVSGQSKGHKEKKSRYQHIKKWAAAEAGHRYAWLSHPLPALERQKRGHTFIFNFFYFSIFQIYTERKEDHRAGRSKEQRADQVHTGDTGASWWVLGAP